MPHDERMGNLPRGTPRPTPRPPRPSHDDDLCNYHYTTRLISRILLSSPRGGKVGGAGGRGLQRVASAPVGFASVGVSPFPDRRTPAHWPTGVDLTITKPSLGLGFGKITWGPGARATAGRAAASRLRSGPPPPRPAPRPAAPKPFPRQGFLEQWSQVVCASDTTIKEAFLSQGSCPPTPIKVRPDSTLGFSGPRS